MAKNNRRSSQARSQLRSPFFNRGRFVTLEQWLIEIAVLVVIVIAAVLGLIAFLRAG